MKNYKPRTKNIKDINYCSRYCKYITFMEDHNYYSCCKCKFLNEYLYYCDGDFIARCTFRGDNSL